MPTNPFSGLISSSFKQNWEDLIDEVIRGYATPSTLYFVGTKASDYPICLDQGPGSPNPYLSGPSKPNQRCSLCKGAGKVFLETSVSANLGVIWDVSKWIGVAPNTFTRENRVQIVCAISHVENLKKCAYIIFNTNLNLNKDKFVRDGDVSLYGIGVDQSHCMSLWRPAG